MRATSAHASTLCTARPDNGGCMRRAWRPILLKRYRATAPRSAVAPGRVVCHHPARFQLPASIHVGAQRPGSSVPTPARPAQSRRSRTRRSADPGPPPGTAAPPPSARAPRRGPWAPGSSSRVGRWDQKLVAGGRVVESAQRRAPTSLRPIPAMKRISAITGVEAAAVAGDPLGLAAAPARLGGRARTPAPGPGRELAGVRGQARVLELNCGVAGRGAPREIREGDGSA